MKRMLLMLLGCALAPGLGYVASSAAEQTGSAASNIMKVQGVGRTVVNFDFGWLFCKGDFATAVVPGFDDSAWEPVRLPHDWSITGPFGPEYASGNGYAPGGIAWYRKHFRVDPAAKSKVVAVEFDGVYDHSEVWLNGHYVGGRPYGYSSFECDLTGGLKVGEDNVLAVRVDHSRFADSRWYTGSGIYRHVRLRFTETAHIAPWGVFVRSPEVSDERATVQVETAVENRAGALTNFSLESEVVAPDGKTVAQLTTSGLLAGNTNTALHQRLTISAPKLWNVEQPRLYTLRSRVYSGPNVLDTTETVFGIRTLRFDPDKGFFLNGEPLKLKGVCVHHEAGCVGAAVPVKIWERRLRTLKELGANAIRTSHNPPAPEFLDLCDRIGLLVKDEAFDEFTPAKNKWVSGRNNGLPARFGYAEEFPNWSVRDVQDMVRRDRNHPSIIMWSIGNEIDYANDPFSHPVLGTEYRPENPPAENLVKLARPLIAAVKQLDSTRPVTAALANVPMSDAVGLGELLDVAGYNYQESRYASDHAKYPKRFLFGSETSHGYREWEVVRDNDYVAGQFLWTGIDYLGEANRWPNRGSMAGLLDLCGFKKPLAWFRQSLWSAQPMVYLCVSGGGMNEGFGGRRARGLESWNWRSNSTVLVRCYTTCAEVQLMLNNKEAGAKRLSEAEDGVLAWSLPFEPGELKAIGRHNGKATCEFSLKTAGPSSCLQLVTDRKQIAADGQDICHVEFRVVDANGTCVPDADNDVTFELEGPAKILGIENGDLNTPTDYAGHTRKAWRGRGLAVIQSTSEPGTIKVRAASPGLQPAIASLETR